MSKALRPRVRLHEDHVAIDVPTGARVLGLAGSLLLPFSTIRDTHVHDPAVLPSFLKSFRVGTHVPGLFALGHFWTGGEHRYYAVARGRPALELVLRGDAPFDRVIVGHSDPAAVAAGIENAIRRESASELDIHAHEEPPE